MLSKRKLRILVCDGTPDILTLITQQLENLGHEVISADDADRAADNFRNSPPIDLIITGYRLTPRSGLDLIGEIKQISPQTKICFSTGEPGLEDAAVLAGANHILPKPYGSKQLQELLSRV